MDIQIDYSRDGLLTEFGIATLKDRYMLPTEESPQDAFARAAKAFSDDKAHAQRIYDYASNLWFMFSTPILSNGGTDKGLPISCYLNYVPDSRDGLCNHYTENGWLASNGGGIGGYWGAVRSDGVNTSTGGRSTGSIPFLKVVDSQMLAFSQGTTRRGSYAAYQDVSHPEIEEFIGFRKPTGGDPNRKCLNLHHGVNIPDDFMRCVEEGKDYALVDPHTGKTVRTIPARKLWELILETRVATGEPYLHFIDTSRKALPQPQRMRGLEIYQSNLCSEITLPTDEKRTAVCCLSSVNLEKFDEWKDDPLFIEDLIRFLDNVIEAFIKQAKHNKNMSNAVYSAMNERSLGLGAMGFHAYLQKHLIPFESSTAMGRNITMFRHIKEKAKEATTKLAFERGKAPDAYPWNVRNMHLLAVAPNASSSIICGTTSPSVEPYRANAYTHKTASGSFLVKNKYLEELLEEKGQNNDATWTSIITNGGSVQHLDCIDDWDKAVFKTAFEIEQRYIVEHAAKRQPFICQAQSINLFFRGTVDRRDLHEVHFKAWEKGLKTLYYCRSESPARPDCVSTKVERKVRKDYNDECLSCEG